MKSLSQPLAWRTDAPRQRAPAVSLPVPGARWGERPERRVAAPGFSEHANAWLRAVGERCRGALAIVGLDPDASFVAQVRDAEALAEAAWVRGDERGDDHSGPAPALLQAVRGDLLRHGLQSAPLARALGLAAVAARHTLGQRPFDSQISAARALLDGRLAEMATGEGKTLAVALAAAAAGLAGVPVHVITANDYLVARDASMLFPLYAALGLRTGRVLQPDSPPERRAAYACDITAVTAKELVFDYLRDGLLPPAARSLRGLCMAIVDEADGILIDEARVPLILSQAVDAADAAQLAQAALQLARRLDARCDFRLDASALSAELTPSGRDRVQAADTTCGQGAMAAAWRHPAHREHAVCTALAACHLVQRERHYVVRDGAVQLVDETTGRVAAGRAWSNGLQALVELKEGLAPTAPLATLAQLTYPKFFTRYHRLCGLSGTLWEARGELRRSYGLLVRRIGLRRPCRRKVLPHRLFASHAALWPAVTARVAALHGAGRPVLVATDSVADAQALSDRLAAQGLPHATLHARCDADEAAIVACAGLHGAVTVSTNMAGRGTDIALDDMSRARGGLHVISCQLNSAQRIDRQLAGRAARQGDPGSVETWLSLDTTLLDTALPQALAPLADTLPPFAVRWLARRAQQREEARQREQRRRLAARDAQLQRQLGFGGAGE